MSVLKTSLVSVVIPTYNHAHFLDRALQSVLDQTYTNWEAIVIDNHSTDDTEDVVQSFSDPRISLLKINNNGIIAASRNAGIHAARGEWIAFLDSDDWWDSDKLYECLIKKDDTINCYYHDVRLVREKPSFLRFGFNKSRQLKKPVLTDLLVGGNIMTNSSVIVRKSLLEQIGGIYENEQMIGCEDYNTWLRLAQITDAFYYVPKTLGYYLFHGSGISRKDMSIPMKYATASFTPLLNRRQKKIVESFLRHTKSRHFFLECNYSGIKSDLLFCLIHGNLSVKFKSIYMIIIVLISKNKMHRVT